MDFPNQEDDQNSKAVYWMFFFRQLFSSGPVIINYFIFGLYVGAHTVIIPQLRKEANSTDVVTIEMASWLSASSAYSAIPWAVILPMIAYRFGRKISLILVSLNLLLGNIVFYCSTNVIDLIISQVSLGLFTSSVMTIAIMVMTEYTSPKYRGIFMTLKGATFFWGIWVANVIGTFFRWRIIGIVIFICGIYNLISCVFSYESPYWLATKGNFDECAKVHRWLKGTDEDSEKELTKLILSQREHLNYKTALSGGKDRGKGIKILNVIRSKGFYKPLVYACLPILLYNFSGKLACTVYAIDIIKKITSSEQMAYKGMLILDAVTVLGMYLGCALCKIMKRRKQLLGFASIAVGFLYILSIYLYMIKLNIISENNYVSLFFLMGFSISISCGPIILSTSCSAELSPLRYRSYFICCFALLSNTIFATYIKIIPFIFKHCGTHGAFLFCGLSASTFICLLYKYLPETKDKTIQEIQELITGVDQNASGKTELLPLKKPEYTTQI